MSIKERNYDNDGTDPSEEYISCLLYTSDAADEEDSVDLGGRRIIKKHPNSYESGFNDQKLVCEEFLMYLI